MLVLFSCGINSVNLVDMIKSKVDNVDFETYSSVDEYIYQSRLRHQVFDRLVFTAKFARSKDDLEKLAQYIRSESSNTEIVFVALNEKTEDLKDEFIRNFNSPMYTCMCLDAPAVKYMIEAVKLPIVDIRVAYNGISSSESHKEGSSNSASNSQIQQNFQDSNLTTQNTENSELINTSDTGNLSTSEQSMNTENVAEIGDYTQSGIGQNFDILGDSSFSVGGLSVESEKADSFEDDDILSLGEFGNKHADSGFVGDDDLEELEEYAKSKANDDTIENEPKDDSFLNQGESGDVSSSDYMQSMGTIDFSEPTSTRDTGFTNESVKNVNDEQSVPKDSRRVVEKGINIVTGLTGSGATAFIVKVATALVKKKVKVLIIDLDTESNGILSFINSKNFYYQGCDDGIVKLNPYFEDGVDILSNGYDSCCDVSNVFNNNFLSRYGAVLIDCPIYNLNLIPDSFFLSSNVIISCISDISKLIETSRALSDRKNVSLNKEIYIDDCCKVANKGINRNDIEAVKESMLFPNGCWLK